jgi:hypothetical protein
LDSDWEQLSREDQQTVFDTRKKNKAKGSKRQVAETHAKGSSKTKTKKLKDVKAQVVELKRTLASLESKKTDGGDDNDSDAPDNAGASFGGRQKKKQKKDSFGLLC